MREMKISKASLLTMWWIFTVASLWLMFFSVSAIESQNTGSSIQLHFDPNNAIQHFQGVKIIATEDGDDSYAIIKKNWWLVWIETDYNFLMSGLDTDSNTIEETVRTSTILWWKGNVVGQVSGSTVFWWEENKIKWNYSSIAWWEWNEVNGSYAAAVWNNNKVDWYNSIAMWSGSKVSGKNSFLWTDGNSSDELQRDNVFVVKWDKGMVVNKNKAHSFAQLTIWGSLIIYSGDTAPQCKPETKWVVKVVNNGDRKCLCSCDGSWGSWWNALHDGVMCPFLCSNTQPEAAMCDNDSGKRDCTTYTYTWTCKTWTVVQWEWAFFVSTEIDLDWDTITNYINWSCQSDTWAVESCRTELGDGWCENKHTENGQCTWDPTIFGEHAVKYTGSDSGVEEDTEWELYDLRYTKVDNKKCAYVCDRGSRIVDWKCVPCPDWAPYSGTTHGCLTDLDCKGEGELYVDNINKKYDCIPYQGWECTYKGASKSSYSLGSIKSGNYKPLTWSMELKCIDWDKFTGSFVPKTCTYECQKNYYCKTKEDSSNPPVCTRPSCDWARALGWGDVDYYYTWWKAWNYQFGSVYSPEELANYFEQWVIYNDGRTRNGSSLTDVDVKYIQEKVWSTNTWVIVNYLRNLNVEQFKSIFNDNFQKCVFRCPKEYRSLTGKDWEIHADYFYRCLSPDTNLEEILNQKNNSCQSVKFFGFSGYIWHRQNQPDKPNIEWQYLNKDLYTQYRNDITKKCIWSCANWYEKIEDYAPRYDTHLYSSWAPRTDLFAYKKDVYKTCYTWCKNNEYLSNANGVLSCKTCPDGLALDLKQTSKIWNTTYEAYRGCKCVVTYSIRSGWAQSCICDNDKKRNSDKTACICKWQTILSGSTCVCPGKSIKNSNNNCSCSSLGRWRIFSGWAKDCVCNAVSGFHYNETLKTCTFSASCPDEKTTLVECLWTCALVETWYMYDENCEYVPKVWKLELNISNTNSQNTKIYHSWDKINYEVTISNTWNLIVENISSTVYYLSGDNEIKIKTKDVPLLWIWKKYSYTWAYQLKTKDFNNLVTNKTWTFTIRLTATWKVQDDYVKDLVVNSPTLTVTIEKK